MSGRWRSGARWAGRAALAMFALLLAVNLLRVGTHLDDLRPIAAGDRAPAFSLPRIGEEGGLARETVELEALRGKVVLLDFWATWCKPCRKAMPALERLQRAFGDRGLEVVSVNTEGPKRAAEARHMASRLAPSATLVSDDGRVADRYQVTTIPHLVVIDRRGMVREVHRGFDGARALDRELSETVRRLLVE